MDLGEILKTLRIDAGLTQKELAKILDIGQSTIVGYEKDGREATITNLSRYADYFDVSLDYLTGRIDDFGTRTTTPKSDGSAPSYSSEERKIIEQYRSLPAQLQDLIRNQLDIYCAPETLNKSDKKV